MAKFDPQAIRRYESRFLEAGGIKTHFIEAGSGDPLVLVHGGGPGADGPGNWYSCLPLFAKRFRTIAVDMLGFGRTDKPDPASFTYSQPARNDHMIAFLEALGAGPVRLIGNSMGGATSLGVAMKRPDLVEKIVLMGSAGIKTDEIPKALGPLMQYDGTVEAMKKVVRALTHLDFEMDDGMVSYRVEVSRQPGTMEALKAAMGWVKEQHGLWYDDDAIREVKTPTLVVGGKADPIAVVSHAYRFLELLENSWGYILPHTGHWVMIERPEEFSAICTDFLSR